MELTDQSPMPWGKYKGEPMEEVPASYLLWLEKEGKASGNVQDYINDNLDVLQKEIDDAKDD